MNPKVLLTMGLSATQLHQWQEDGFLIIPDFLSPTQVAQLKQRATELRDEFNPTEHPVSLFSTDNEQNRDEYFLSSGDKIRYFFEEACYKEGKLQCAPREAINKVGHGLHLHDPVYRQVSQSNEIQGIAKSLGFQQPVVLQSMIIYKLPQVGGAVRPHLDSTFLYTDPPSAVGFWFALDDCDESNGTLMMAPGSHKRVKPSQRWIRKGTGTEFVGEAPDLSQFKLIPQKIKAGSLVLIHGSVVHASAANKSDRPRNAYTFHVIDRACHYDELNWLQPLPAENLFLN